MEVRTGYKQTEVGVIPEEWDAPFLKDLFTFKNGLNKAKEFFGYGTPIVNYMDVYGRRGIYANELKGRVSLSRDELKAFNVRKGDVFFTRTSETAEEVGISSVMLDEPTDTVFSGFVLRARPKDDSLDDQFKQHCFSTSNVRKQITSQSTETTRALTNGRCLGAVAIARPPTPEQRAIAEALSDVDELLSGLERLITKKRDLKQAAMQQLLTGKTRLPGFSGEWEVKRLGDVLKVRHGKSQHGITVPDGEFPILASGGEIGRTNTPLYEKPSVLIGRKGTIDSPQYAATPFWTVDTLFFTEISAAADAKFVFYKFTMIPWRSYNEASGVPSLNAKTIENIEVLFPLALAEQTAIAEVLSDMDAELTALEQRREKTRALKQAMMQELLTGNTRLV